MNSKRIWLMMPAATMLYLMIALLLFVFFGTQVSWISHIMEKVFQNNALPVLAALLLHAVGALALSVVCSVLAIVKKWDALSLAKAAMILKLAQIPAYVAIFVLGVFLFIAIWTIPFVILFVMVDYLVLVMTGLLNTAAVIGAVREKAMPVKSVIWVMVLQLVFCADVVASVVFYKQLKKQKQTAAEAEPLPLSAETP